MLTDRAKEILDQTESKMQEALRFLEEDLKTYRVGKANPAIFNGVTIDATDNSFDNHASGDARVRFLGTYKSLTINPGDNSILLMAETLHYPASPAILGAQSAYFKIGEDGANPPLITSFNIHFAKPGDINGDGVVDALDVNIVINIVLGKASASSYPGIADVSGDNTVDVNDVNMVINIILGKN